jgi:protein arginine kinase
MEISSLLQKKNQLFSMYRKTDPKRIVLGFKVKVIRNIKSFSFPKRASVLQLELIKDQCLEAIKKLPSFKKNYFYNSIENISYLEKHILIERDLINENFVNSKCSGIFINFNQSISILINEEDHLVMNFINPFYKKSIDNLFKFSIRVTDFLKKKIDYEFSNQFGYLTSSLNNLGTGMKIFVTLHLPGLVMTGEIENLIKKLNIIGIKIKGFLNSKLETYGSIFKISNKQTLGLNPIFILERMKSILENIIRKEEQARKKIIHLNPLKFQDKIGRAFGILSNMKLISFQEGISLLSLFRLIIDIGLISKDWRKIIDLLFIEIQPAHIQYYSNISSIEEDDYNLFRSSLIKSRLKKIRFIKSYSRF